MAQVYFNTKRGVTATFDLFIRSAARPFYVACGLSDVLLELEKFRFSEEDINYLRGLALFEKDFLEYLRNFRFKGEVWGIREPEIVFPQEPILHVTGNIIETQVVESMLLNRINLATTLATKAARVVMAAKGRGVYDFSLRRTQGGEASLSAAKYSYIVGAKGTSNLLAGCKYGIPVVGTMAHSFVMSFEREIESFFAFARQFPTKSILLIDTYDTQKGIENAIRVARYLKKIGITLLGVRLDSGNIAEEAKRVRMILDKEGFIDTIIFASGNLDEYRIRDLINKRAPVDAFGVGTNMGCSADRPFTDVIYKLVEIQGDDGKFIPAMKLSKGKTTLPGKKQVFRIYSRRGVIEKDVIASSDERIKGEKLLFRLMHNGKCCFSERSILEQRRLFERKFALLPSYLKQIDARKSYPVVVSPILQRIVRSTKKAIKERIKEKVVFFDVDTQHDFLSSQGALYVPGAERVVKNLVRLTNVAEKKKILVISSRDTHSRDDPEFKDFPSHCIRGTKGSRKISGTLLAKHKVVSFRKVYPEKKLKLLSEQVEQIILEKNTINVLSNPNTLLLLNILLPDRIYVYGVATDYCVKAVVEGLVANNFTVTLVTDAVKEINYKEKKELFRIWRKRGVEFLTTDKVIQRVSARGR